MTRHLSAFILVVGLVASGGAVTAHHSYADFDLETTVSIEGVLEKVLFANPHVVLVVRTKDRGVLTVSVAPRG